MNHKKHIIVQKDENNNKNTQIITKVIEDFNRQNIPTGQQNIIVEQQTRVQQVITGIKQNVNLQLKQQANSLNSKSPTPSQSPHIQQMNMRNIPQQYCIPLIPITFYDCSFYQQKCIQIKVLLAKPNRQLIVEWIQTNNRHICGLTNNCKLLLNVQSDYFWGTVLVEMLQDLIQYSKFIAQGKLKFFKHSQSSFDKKNDSFLDIKRLKCYMILIQMFFGLIPNQYHNIKYSTYCTLGYYFQKRTPPQPQSQPIQHPNQPIQCQQSTSNLIQQDIQNLNKIKSLIHYFTVMSLQSNKKSTKHQFIRIDLSEFKFSVDSFYNSVNKSQNTNKYQMNQDYGSVGDQIFISNFILNDKSQNQHKFNSGSKTHHAEQINSIFQIQGVFDDYKHQNSQKYESLNIFLFQHPQAFIIKLLITSKIGCQGTIVVKNLKKYVNCTYKNKRLVYLSRYPLQTKPEQSFPYLMLSCPSNKVIKSFAKLKSHLQTLIQSFQLLKSQRNKIIQICFDQYQHKDIGIDFLLIWIGVTYVRIKSMIRVQIGKYDQRVKYDIQRIRKEFQGTEVVEVLAMIQQYIKFKNTKQLQYPEVNSISFITYFKRHIYA